MLRKHTEILLIQKKQNPQNTESPKTSLPCLLTCQYLFTCPQKPLLTETGLEQEPPSSPLLAPKKTSKKKCAQAMADPMDTRVGVTKGKPGEDPSCG